MESQSHERYISYIKYLLAINVAKLTEWVWS